MGNSIGSTRELALILKKHIPVLLVSSVTIAAAGPALGRGVSPYLPLNLSPAVERQVERALILAGKPIIRRPIPAAVVLDALPQVCTVDIQLCTELRRYLARFMKPAALTQLRAGLAATAGDSGKALPNAHGMAVDSPWQIAASGYYQITDHFLATVGGVVTQDQSVPTGTLLSAGFDWAQLDIGYRDHWLSPSSDGSFLIGTQAPTLPSITLSNYRPITPLGGTYEVFLGKMQWSDKISYVGGQTQGHPNLLGLQLGIEPVQGYSLAVNRLMQYGGGARGQGGVSGLKNALLRNDTAQIPDGQGGTNEFGNQVASITSTYGFPGKVPFQVYFEYAGEDNLYEAGYRLGKVALSAGIDFPQLWSRYDLSYHVSERQDAWYVHHLYGDGLTNEGHVIGHWFGDDRTFGDSPGGYTHSFRVGRRSDSGDYWQAQYRNSVNWRFTNFPYRQAHQLALSYHTDWFGRAGTAEFDVGRDVFGEDFVRLSASIDLASAYEPMLPARREELGEGVGQLYVDLGANRSQVQGIYWDGLPDTETADELGYHLAIGVRRQISERSDLGIKMEFDEVDGNSLVSFRALDYRYRIGRRLAVGMFLGAARYQIMEPAWGYYWGAGAQYLNVMPGWDLALDLRHHEKVSRNNLLSTDRGYGVSTVSFRDIDGIAFYVTRRTR